MRKGKIGFTLVEVIVVMAIFGIMFGVIFEILSSGRNTWNFGFTAQDVEDQARQGLERIVREIYLTNGGKVSVSGALDSRILAFQVPIGFDVNGNLIWGADGVADQQLRYSRNASSQLLREVLDAASNPISGLEKVLANSVQALNFTLNGNIIVISLTIQKTTVDRKSIAKTLSSSVRFRN